MNPLKRLWKRNEMIGDLSEEIEQHLEEKIEALVAKGMLREDAVHAARRSFGNAALLEQRSREAWMSPWIENLCADAKFTVRQLRKSPGFTATAVLTLALGIGATTAIFSLYLQVLLRSLPTQEPQQLVLLRATGATTGSVSVEGDVDLGLRTDHLLQFSTDARGVGTKLEQTPALMKQIAEAIRREPGVTSVGYSTVGILSGDRSRSDITIAGYTPHEGDDMKPDQNSVSPDFFTTFGIPLLTGRVLTNSDETETHKVAVVNDLFASHYFGGQRQALGQMFCFGTGQSRVPDTTIVGVVKSAESESVGEKALPMIYLPFGQRKRQSANFYIRTALPPKQVFSEVRRAIQGVNPALPLNDLETMTDQINGDTATPHLLAMLSISFGLLAILLAAIGMYGVLAYSMTQRTREIGIRIALGADRFNVAQLVVRQFAVSALVAAVFGIPISLLLTRYLRNELYYVHYNDPWSFAAATVVTFTAIAVAAYFPVRRAVSVDPVRALRAE